MKVKEQLWKGLAILLMCSLISIFGCREVGESLNSSGNIAVAAENNPAGEWIQDTQTGKWWFRYPDGSYPASQWLEINARWYHFDSSGWMETNKWIQSGGKWYYLNAYGAAEQGWLNLNGVVYYFSQSGAMQIGWQYIDGSWYYFNQYGARQTGLISLADGKYYLNSSGVMQTQWVYFDVGWRYFNSDGRMHYGWVYDGGQLYYCNWTNGVMMTGWQHYARSGVNNGDSYWNYFHSPSGYLVTDSDVKGCSHGFNTYGENRNLSGCRLSYYVGFGAGGITDSISSAASRWNNGSVMFYRTYEFSHSDIEIVRARFDDPYQYGLTEMFKYRDTSTEVRPSQSDWRWCRVTLANNLNIPVDTICHEFGHVLGLSHRMTDWDSLMKTKGRNVTHPQEKDYAVVYHLY